MSSKSNSRDENLRNNRLVFYENDVARLNAEIDTFLELSKARCALLVDRDGHLVTRCGEPVKTAEDTISALIAGSFAATREMARLLGEDEFSTLFHQGHRDSIQVSLVGNRALFAAVFDERTNLGLVRYYAAETTKRLDGILEDMSARAGDGLREDAA